MIHHPRKRQDDVGTVRYLLGGFMAELDVLTSEEWQAAISANGLEDRGTVLLPHGGCNPVTGVVARDALFELASEATRQHAERVVLLLDRSSTDHATFGLAAGSR